MHHGKPLAGVVGLILWCATLAGAQTQERPNILWITCEDSSPALGCYGDSFAVTPTLDKLSAEGVRYTAAFAPIGVCAPSRSCLITGIYPPTLGSHHMRCQTILPADVRCFPAYLRDAGYFCTNNSKTDYNFAVPKDAWDQNGGKATWKNRKPGQPFMSVFNFTTTHESQIRTPDAEFAKVTQRVTSEQRHDPAKVPVPPYHPDTPEVRRDWARHYDLMTALDYQVADLLAELEKDGLANNTIVFFFSDHGTGMPRSKRWLYDSSLRVPFIVRFPEKYRSFAPAAPGSAIDRLVSFVDFGPTVLSLLGVPVAPTMQGEPFLGSQAKPPREYVYGFRDRMDERYDMVRAVRDRRYKYLRNYFPDVPYAQHLDYMEKMPTMQVWRKLAAEGKLNPAQSAFMAPNKPLEELYDTESDPHEINNLAKSLEHQATLERLRKAHNEWVVSIADLGLLPEEEMHRRSNGEPPANLAMSGRFPVETVFRAAMLVGEDSLERAQKMAASDDSAVRFWAITGWPFPVYPAMLEDFAVSMQKDYLKDPSPSVRLAAVRYLKNIGKGNLTEGTLLDGLKDSNEFVRLRAANLADEVGNQLPSLRPAMEALKKDRNQYVQRVVDHYLANSVAK